LAIGAQPVDLDEGAGQLLRFPWRGGFASAQADHHILNAHRLTGPQGQVADDAVALVEQTKDRDALGHRSHSRLLGCGARHVGGDGLIVVLYLLGSLAPARNGEQQDQQGSAGMPHAYSGFHAS
jgi:hypothetical protein